MRDPTDNLLLAAEPIVAEQMRSAQLQWRSAAWACVRHRDRFPLLIVRFAEYFRYDVVGAANKYART
jgi:hypothetical protein